MVDLTKAKATTNVQDALNDLFAIRPALTPREARKLLEEFKRDLDIMLDRIDEMEAMGVPPDFRLEK